MKRTIVFSAVLINLISMNIHCQKRMISGEILDPDGNPLPYISVVFPNTTLGTYSDLDGAFCKHVPDSITGVLFTGIGLKSQTFKFEESVDVTFVVTMRTDIVELYGVTIEMDTLTGICWTHLEENQDTVAFYPDQSMANHFEKINISSSSPWPAEPGRNEILRSGAAPFPLIQRRTDLDNR